MLLIGKKSYFIFLGLDWVHFEPCEGGGEKRRERRIPETMQGPAKTWLQKMELRGSSLSSFYPAVWLSIWLSICLSNSAG